MVRTRFGTRTTEELRTMKPGLPLFPDTVLIAGEPIDRARMAEIIAVNRESVRFEDCSFDGADLSELAMGGFAFERCSFIDTSFKGAVLDRSHWKGCRVG